ncbi:MAG: formylmethanofuran dehydrogenase, partial [Eubacteriaceae bacterium]|nr:formylmethanofuran dehydrogenase [Eubacteriaceae bacterium]
MKLLEVTGRDHSLYCIAESSACYLDGIQWAFGTTMGNGNIELRDRGKTAFNFCDRASGKSARFCAKKWPS